MCVPVTRASDTSDPVFADHRGTSLAGGEGSVARTALGVLIIGVLNNGMVLLSVPTFYQIIGNGALLLMAVIVDQLQKGRETLSVDA